MDPIYLDSNEIHRLRRKGLKVYIFTFGHGQEHAGHCQIIMADGWLEARRLMFEHHKDKWSFQYTEEEWRNLFTPDPMFYVPETPLEYIVVQSGTTWVKIRREYHG